MENAVLQYIFSFAIYIKNQWLPSFVDCVNIQMKVSFVECDNYYWDTICLCDETHSIPNNV